MISRVCQDSDFVEIQGIATSFFIYDIDISMDLGFWKSRLAVKIYMHFM